MKSLFRILVGLGLLCYPYSLVHAEMDRREAELNFTIKRNVATGNQMENLRNLLFSSIYKQKKLVHMKLEKLKTSNNSDQKANDLLVASIKRLDDDISTLV